MVDLAAGVGVGAFDSFDAVEKFIHISESNQPDPTVQDAYRKVKVLFEEAYQALLPLFEKL